MDFWQYFLFIMSCSLMSAMIISLIVFYILRMLIHSYANQIIEEYLRKKLKVERHVLKTGKTSIVIQNATRNIDAINELLEGLK